MTTAIPAAAPTFDEINAEMQSLMRLFNDFRILLTDGKSVDLTGVESRVKEFCDRVGCADVEIRKSLMLDFSTLLSLLESLESELRTARDHAKP